jgi:hypothetical protein
MRNVALELTNLTSMIDNDVIHIFDFEKKISKVILFVLIDIVYPNFLK